MHDDYRHVVREHAFDKCWLLDITRAEVEQLIDSGAVIEHHDLGEAGVRRSGCSAGNARCTWCTWSTTRSW